MSVHPKLTDKDVLEYMLRHRLLGRWSTVFSRSHGNCLYLVALSPLPPPSDQNARENRENERVTIILAKRPSRHHHAAWLVLCIFHGGAGEAPSGWRLHCHLQKGAC